MNASADFEKTEKKLTSPKLNSGQRFVFKKLTKDDMEKGAKDFKKNFLPIFKKLSKE